MLIFLFKILMAWYRAIIQLDDMIEYLEDSVPPNQSKRSFYAAAPIKNLE
jgi:hypothetical protein